MKTRPVFVVRSDDELARMFESVLSQCGFATKQLSIEEEAPRGSIAIYTDNTWERESPGRRGKHVRSAACDLLNERPEWAKTPFLVALKPWGKTDGIFEAALQIGKQYTEWLAGISGRKAPWLSVNQEPSRIYKRLFDQWYSEVRDALDSQQLNRILSSEKPNQFIGYGGYIVFGYLFATGRVVTERDEHFERAYGNKVFAELTGYKGPVVAYGTSDVANVFELLQTIKAGDVLDLPTVFDVYTNAHYVDWWVRNGLNPSLYVFNQRATAEDLELRPDSKYTEIITALFAEKFVNDKGLGIVAPEAVEAAGVPFWQWYQAANSLVAVEVTKLLCLNTRVFFTTTEELISATEWWKMDARDYADGLEMITGHPVVALNTPEGAQIRTDMTRYIPAESSIEKLHKAGWWLGGSGLYRSVYSLGIFGTFVAAVPDTKTGDVHLLARLYLGEGSGLHLCPVGLFRMITKRVGENWFSDPWVFLALLRTWGEDKARDELSKIWNAMEVPLAPEHIGRKTVATVDLDGVSVEIL